ncbi:MAG TPA: biopolymer transporter ExbD [Casimicrobiaceae bacterium]|nr:biopolymer transporter ExbD [Casimicrobiaceae bacterium]
MRRVRKPINQINVVPYIDVMLVLLVIFMVTAPLVAPGEIQLPTVGSKLTVALDPVRVRVNPDKSMTVQDQSAKNSRPVRVTLDTLVEVVLSLQAGREQPVVIDADKGSRYEDVIGILDRLQLGGVKRVGLLARPTP